MTASVFPPIQSNESGLIHNYPVIEVQLDRELMPRFTTQAISKIQRTKSNVIQFNFTNSAGVASCYYCVCHGLNKTQLQISKFQSLNNTVVYKKSNIRWMLNFICCNCFEDREDLLRVAKTNFSMFIERAVLAEQARLFECCKNGDLKGLKALISKGVNLNQTDKSRKSALHFAVEAGQSKCAQLLINHGAAINAQTLYSGSTPLHLAIMKGQVECVRLLCVNKALLEIQDKRDGYTALHIAVDRGDFACVSLLISLGASLSAKVTGSEFEPIHLASSKNQPQILQCLIRHGADICSKTKLELTALIIAANNGSIDCLKILIQHSSDNIDAVDIKHCSALYHAICKKNYQCAQYLLEHNARVDIPNIERKTPLLAAAKQHDEHAIELLVKHGADPFLHDKKLECPASYLASRHKMGLYLTLTKHLRNNERSTRRLNNYYGYFAKLLYIPPEKMTLDKKMFLFDGKLIKVVDGWECIDESSDEEHQERLKRLGIV